MADDNDADGSGAAIMFIVTPGGSRSPAATLCPHHLGLYLERHQKLTDAPSMYTVQPDATGLCRICTRDPHAGAWEWSDEFHASVKRTSDADHVHPMSASYVCFAYLPEGTELGPIVFRTALPPRHCHGVITNCSCCGVQIAEEDPHVPDA